MEFFGLDMWKGDVVCRGANHAGIVLALASEDGELFAVVQVMQTKKEKTNTYIYIYICKELNLSSGHGVLGNCDAAQQLLAPDT